MANLADTYKGQKSFLLLHRNTWRKDWGLLSLVHNYQNIISFCCTEHTNVSTNTPSSIFSAGKIYELERIKIEGRYAFVPKSDDAYEKLRLCLFCSPRDEFGLTIRPYNQFKLHHGTRGKKYIYGNAYEAIQLINSFYVTSEKLSLQVVDW